MKRIFLALALLPSLCLGAAFDFGIDQRSAANNSWEKRLLVSPPTNGIMAYDPGTKLASWLTLGQGLQVSSGVLSSTVLQGPKGDQGLAGPAGPQGPKGETGLTGSQGIQGATGLTGPKGDTGEQGIAGVQGPQGTSGSEGPKGDTGSQGVAGIQGPKGEAGPTGPKGDAGSQGPIGLTGAQGIQGPIGLIGATGPAGAAAPTPVSAPATRALNTAFQISATRPTLVSYSVDISVVSLLLTGTQGTITLQYADTAAMASPVTVSVATNSTGGVLNVANIGTATLAGFVPAGKFVRLTTTNVSGTPTFTFRNGQETIF